MSGFQVPFSSSPPSTPDRRSNGKKNSYFGDSNPSTTPAGPPPSSAGSFTPAGPPPSFFGSSMGGTIGSVKPLSFSQQPTFEPSFFKSNSPRSSASAKFTRSPAAPQRSGLGNEYQTSRNASFQAPLHDSEEDEDEDDGALEYIEADDHNLYDDSPRYGDDDGNAMMDADGQYEEDEHMGDYNSERNRATYAQHSSSPPLVSSPAALRQSREYGVGGTQESMLDSLSELRKPFTYGQIAKSLYSQMGIPTINESDDLVLNTEAIITRLYEEGIGTGDNDDLLQHALRTIPGELTKLWATYHRNTRVHDSEEYAASIGPGPRASAFAKANFLAGLTLQIHHPHKDDARTFGHISKPLPQTMLEWMDEHHDPSPSQFEEIQAHRPSPASHRLFWDTVLNGLLRGKVVATVNILKSAGWRYAKGGLDDIRDPSGQVGYTGVALANVEKVISAATQALSQCPAVQGNWDIRGSDWTLFRLRVSQALEDLKRFAEGRDRDRIESTAFEAEGFGISSSAGRSGTYSRIAKKAESQVPWHIYQNLLTLYGLVMGDSSAIIENSQDWCEATVGLLVWWDEGKEDKRLTLGRSQTSHRVSRRESDSDAYLRKLRRSFESATAETTDFQVNTLNPVEVGLASVFEGNSEAIVGFLQAWSGPVSSAVAEVASLGGWLPHTEPQNLINMESLDQEDMDLLGITSQGKLDSVKDQTLIAYAKSLSQHGPLKSAATYNHPEIIREGWEIAIEVLGRLDSAPRSEEMVGEFLNGFPLVSSSTVDKLWRLLNDLGMAQHAESTAESYADLLAEGSHKYGEALWYYALSHKPNKVKDVLDLLISFSLIQSTAYPPEPDLDDHLKRLISSPKRSLMEISKMDIEAAELLHKMLSGYATLRRFYDLRDDKLLSVHGGKQLMGATARKTEAVSALLTIITSSDDNIRGGLYDEERGAVVSVDFLLALLGEAMFFVDQPGFTITASQIDTLLKAIEDLQAVEPRVYSACNEFLQTVIASGQGLKGSSPTDMLRKSVSNASGTSSFSLVGSSMLASQLKQSMGSSGVMVKGNIKRGWDWRRGISAGTTGDEILRVLRLGLAKDLAKAWLIEADNRM